MIRLQNRDKQILKLCYEQQFLLSSHITDHFFGNKYRAAMQRIQELHKAGYFKLSTHPEHARKQVIRLSQYGRKVASDFSQISIPDRLSFGDEFINHDAIVTSVRLRLESMWDAKWISEKAIRQFELSEIPDGLFIFDNGKKVAIEIENSIKGRSRFIDRLKSWKDVKVKLVLYVATNDEIYSYLSSYLKDAPKSPAFGLIKWDELKREVPSVWSPVGELDLFSERTIQ